MSLAFSETPMGQAKAFFFSVGLLGFSVSFPSCCRAGGLEFRDCFYDR